MKITKEQGMKIIELFNDATTEETEYVVEKMLTILDIEHSVNTTIGGDTWLQIVLPKEKETAYTSCHCCGEKVPHGETMWKLGSWYFCSTNCLVDNADAVKARATK